MGKIQNINWSSINVKAKKSLGGNGVQLLATDIDKITAVVNDEYAKAVARADGLGRYGRMSLMGLKLEFVSQLTENAGSNCITELEYSFSGDLTRTSFSILSGPVKNIVALLNNGYVTSLKEWQLGGIWHGVETPAMTRRDGSGFMQQLKENIKWSVRSLGYTGVDVKIDDQYEL